MLLLMNIFIASALYVLWLMIDHWGTGFALGLFTGCMLYQVAHRVTYGHWFGDPPKTPDPQEHPQQHPAQPPASSGRKALSKSS